MTAKIILLAVAVIGFMVSTVFVQRCGEKDWLSAGIMCEFAAVVCLIGSAAMFGAIAMEVFS